jgi:hypothetical protein
MKSRSDILLKKSIGSALAAIELYNKPNFENKEECFLILLQNAWELLLKSKILRDNSNKLSSVLLKKDKRYIRNAFGDKISISFTESVSKCNPPLHLNIKSNLEQLNMLRNRVVHLYSNAQVSQIVFELGLAAILNYRIYIEKWFGQNLAKHITLIMPVAFVKNIVSVQLDANTNFPEVNRIIVDYLNAKSEASSDDNNHFCCEMKVRLLSVKDNRCNSDTPLVAIDNMDSNAKLIHVLKLSVLEQYPLEFKTLYNEVKQLNPGLKTNDLHRVISKHGVKENSKYCHKSFSSQKNRIENAKDSKKGNPRYIYNNECVKFLDGIIKQES